MNTPGKNALVLASASPRRRELLSSIGLDFSIKSPDVDESFVDGEDPIELTKILAEKKSRAVAATVTQGFVLAADTIVAQRIEQRWQIFGKPETPEHACEMLQRLQGGVHSVVSAFSLLNCETSSAHTEAVVTEVQMRAMSADEILSYVATGEALDKAGAYGIQGKAAAFITRIDGSYTNVVGLPLAEVALVLEENKLWSSANLVAVRGQ